MCNELEHSSDRGPSGRRNFLRTTGAAGFVDSVARTNVDDRRRHPQDESGACGARTSGAIKIAGAMYNLESGAVDFP